jgi:hypothetical protein
MDVGGWDDVGMEWEFNKKSAETRLGDLFVV